MLLVAAAGLAAQEVRWETVAAGAGGRAVEICIAMPEAVPEPTPMLSPVALTVDPSRDRAAVEQATRTWVAQGLVGVGVLGARVPAEVLDHLHVHLPVSSGRVLVTGDPEVVVPLVVQWPFEFYAAWLGAPSEQDRAECRALGVRVIADRAELGSFEAPAADVVPVHLALDDFHDAATKGDGDRYFGRFAPEGIFLGTDPGERWDLDAFRGFARKYFERGDAAWIYMPRARTVQLSPDGTFAFFDEVVSNRHYGDCRGTGVLRLEGETWLLCQYSLSVPVPNDLTRGLVAQIRAYAAGGLGQGVTVIAVRHAEKEAGGGRDPGLTDAGLERAQQLARTLSDLPVRAVLSSPYARTRLTATPTAEGHGVPVEVLPAQDYDRWLARIGELDRGVVVVVGHSNTVPELLRRLGFEAEAARIGESDYDRLFVGRLGADLLALRY